MRADDFNDSIFQFGLVICLFSLSYFIPNQDLFEHLLEHNSLKVCVLELSRLSCSELLCQSLLYDPDLAVRAAMPVASGTETII